LRRVQVRVQVCHITRDALNVMEMITRFDQKCNCCLFDLLGSTHKPHIAVIDYQLAT